MNHEDFEALKLYIDRRKFTKLRIGVIEDPTIQRAIDVDGNLLNYDPMEVKVTQTAQSQSLGPSGVNIVNTTTGQVSVRWLDGDGIGHIFPEGQALSSYVNQTINAAGLADAVEPIINLSSGLWGGLHPGTGYMTICGIEFMPPAGSVVIVGYTARDRGIILGYFLPNYVQVYNSTNSLYSVLNPGEVRLTSYGGSYFHLKNLPNNSLYDESLQVADIELGHALGGYLTYSSVRGDKAGQFKIFHPSGSNILIDDDGAISLFGPPIEDFTEDNKGIISAFISILKNGAIALKSTMDITMSAATSIFVRVKDQFDFISNSIAAVVLGNTNLNLNSVDLTTSGRVTVSTYEEVAMIFNNSVSIDCRTNLKISSGGKIKITQDGSISFISTSGNVDLTAVGAASNSSGGVCTAQTMCPVSGFHIGAVGNTVRASNIAPVVVGAPL